MINDYYTCKRDRKREKERGGVVVHRKNIPIF